MTQYEKSAATLELPAILAMLAHHAVSDEAKARAAALSPATDAATVQRLLAETSAARGMMVKRGSPSFSGVKDVRASLSRADMGGTLNIRELMDIAGVLTAARMARTYAAGDGRGNEKTCIDGLFNSLITNRFLEDKITGHRGRGRALRRRKPGACVHPPPHPRRLGPREGGAAEDHLLAELFKGPAGPHNHHAV